MPRRMRRWRRGLPVRRLPREKGSAFYRVLPERVTQPQRTRNQDQGVRKSQGRRQFPSATAGSTLDQPAEKPRYKRIAPKVAARRPEKVREVRGASAKHRQARRPFHEVERLAQKSAPAAQRRAAQEHGEGLARQRHRSEGQGNPELT